MDVNLYRLILDMVVRLTLWWVDRAASIALAANPDDAKAKDAYVDQVHKAITQGRKLAWAATAIYLDRRSIQATGEHAYVPTMRPYRPQAVEKVLRQSGADFTRPHVRHRMAQALMRHVENAARETVIRTSVPPRSVAEFDRQEQLNPFLWRAARQIILDAPLSGRYEIKNIRYALDQPTTDPSLPTPGAIDSAPAVPGEVDAPVLDADGAARALHQLRQSILDELDAEPTYGKPDPGFVFDDIHLTDPTAQELARWADEELDSMLDHLGEGPDLADYDKKLQHRPDLPTRKEDQADSAGRKPRYRPQKPRKTIAPTPARLEAALGAEGAEGWLHDEEALRRAYQERRKGHARRSVAWARRAHPERGRQGPVCAFCLMLVSRGAVYHSQRTALAPASRRSTQFADFLDGAGFHPTAYHNNCRCTAEPVYDEANWDGAAEAEAAYKIYSQFYQPGQGLDYEGLQKFINALHKHAPQGEDAHQ